MQHRKGNSTSKRLKVKSQGGIALNMNRFSGLPVEDSQCEFDVDCQQSKVVNDNSNFSSYCSGNTSKSEKSRCNNAMLVNKKTFVQDIGHKKLGLSLKKSKSGSSKPSQVTNDITHIVANGFDTPRSEGSMSHELYQGDLGKKSDSERFSYKSDKSHTVSSHHHSIIEPYVEVENEEGLAVAGNLNDSKERYTDTNIIENFTLAGKPVAKKVNILHIHNKSTDLIKCIEQQHKPFGFLPITELKYRDCYVSTVPNEIYTWDTFDAIKVHEKVKATGTYNFLEARIQIPSSINLELLDKVCEGYWDWQLPLLLRYGFPLDFPKKALASLISSEVNHSSALQFPSDIENYLKSEIQHHAIIGPYKNLPFCKDTQVSPFISRPKPDSIYRRVIVDLSWPTNASVNYHTLDNVYLDTVFKLQYPTIDAITDQLVKLGKKALIYKIDLSRAFCQLPIDPHDYNLLCLAWDKAYFVIVCVLLGKKSAVVSVVT